MVIVDPIITPNTPDNNLLLMWQAPYIAHQMGYTGADESDERTFEFLGKLLDMYEQTATARQMLAVSADREEHFPLEQRETIMNLLAVGESIIDVPGILNDEFSTDDWCLATVVQCLTRNTPTVIWKWTALEWLFAESKLVEENGLHSAGELSELLGVAEQTLVSVSAWYGVKPYRVANKGNRFDEVAASRKALLVDWLSLEPALTPAAAWARLVPLFPTVSKSSVRNMLHKLRASTPSPT